MIITKAIYGRIIFICSLLYPVTVNMSGCVQTDKVQQDEELITNTIYPRREEFQWRPAPILCKRFDLVDPYMGKVVYLILQFF